MPERKLYDLNALASNRQISQLFGVVPSAVVNWRTRYADFPAPVHMFDGAPMFDRDAVVAWHATHTSDGRFLPGRKQTPGHRWPGDDHGGTDDR